MIGPVGLVEIEIIGVQPLQAGLDGPYDVVPVQRRHSGPLRGLQPAMAGSADLGGDDHGIPAFGLHPTADDLLGTTSPSFAGWHRIILAGIEKIDAGINRPVEDPE